MDIMKCKHNTGNNYFTFTMLTTSMTSHKNMGLLVYTMVTNTAWMKIRSVVLNILFLRNDVLVQDEYYLTLNT